MNIRVNKIINVTDGTAPYTYQWSADQSCVSFSQASGTTQNEIETEVIFNSQDCFDLSPTITLTVTDANGCTSSSTISVGNPCTSLAMSAITVTDTNTFSVSAGSPSCSSTNIQWIYDNSIYDKESENSSNFSSTLNLKYKEGVVLPSSTTIKAIATDCKNCVKEVTKQHSVCIPQAQPVTIFLNYNENTGLLESGDYQFSMPTNCANYVYNLDKLAINLPNHISIIPVSASEGIYKFQTTPEYESSTISGTYSVVSTENVKSTTASITLNTGQVSTDASIDAIDKTFSLPISASSGDTFSIPIDSELILNGLTLASVDWSSFQIVTPPNSDSPSITLSTNINGQHIINYEVPNPISSTDSFSWVICDITGEVCSRSINYTITESLAAPVANDDSVTITCGTTTTFPILDNDTPGSGVLAPSTVTIKSNPSKGTAIANSNGTITYSALSKAVGTDTFTYTVKNSNNVESNTATVTVTINCAGQDSKIALCN